MNKSADRTRHQNHRRHQHHHLQNIGSSENHCGQSTSIQAPSSVKMAVNEQFLDNFEIFAHCMYDHALWVSHNRQSSQIPVMEKIVALMRGRCNYSTFMNTLVDYFIIRLNIDTLEVSIADKDENFHPEPGYDEKLHLNDDTARQTTECSTILPFTLIHLPDIGGKKRAGVLVNRPLVMRFLNNVGVMLYTLNKERVRILLTEYPLECGGADREWGDVIAATTARREGVALLAKQAECRITPRGDSSCNKRVLRCRLTSLFHHEKQGVTANDEHYDGHRVDGDSDTIPHIDGCGELPPIAQCVYECCSTHRNNSSSKVTPEVAEFTRLLKVNKMGLTSLFCIWNLFERVLYFDAWTESNTATRGAFADSVSSSTITDDSNNIIRIDTVTHIKGPFTSSAAAKRGASLTSTFNFNLL